MYDPDGIVLEVPYMLKFWTAATDACDIARTACRTTVLCYVLHVASAPTRAAATYSASYSGILLGLRQRVAGTTRGRGNK